MAQGIQYYIVDTETSGLRAGFHDLVEISIIRYHDRLQMSKIIKALNPENANYDALQITGKTMKDLYKGIDRSEMVNIVNDFFNMDGLTTAHRCIVGHNISFDRKFVHHVWSEHNQLFPANLWLDTLSLSKKVAKLKNLMKNAFGDKQKFNLYAACDLFGIKKTGVQHTAQDDTRNTYFLFKYFMDNGIDILDHIKRIPHDEEDEQF